MNKTVTITISGILFHIEEEAFEVLQNYISAIKVAFQQTESGSEIVLDIEARIAELLQGRITPGKQALVLADVQLVMETMGRPEEFASSEEDMGAASGKTNSPPPEKIKRRLFRDPDERTVGGVCSGLAAYFDIDVVWVRLATFLLIFFGGLSLWVYLILWLVIPEARSTADKFAMRGEPANINTIFRSFQQEAEFVKERINKYGQDFKDRGHSSTLIQKFNYFLHKAFSMLGRLLGLFFVLIGAALLIAYGASLTGISIADKDVVFENWRHSIFATSSDYTLAIIAIALLLGIPVLMLLNGGIRLLFRLRYRNRWLNRSLGTLWTIGFFVGLYVTISTFLQFRETSRFKERLRLSATTDTLLVKLNPDDQYWRDMNFDNEQIIEKFLRKDKNGYLLGKRDGRLTIIGSTALNIMYTEGDSARLVLVRSARGDNKRQANQNAKEIQYNFRQDHNTLYFNRFFMVNEDAKFRLQDLSLQLLLPEGTVVELDPSVQHFLDDIENTSNIWDGAMAGRRWLMTERGLQCIDCDHLDKEGDGKSEE